MVLGGSGGGVGGVSKTAAIEGRILVSAKRDAVVVAVVVVLPAARHSGPEFTEGLQTNVVQPTARTTSKVQTATLFSGAVCTHSDELSRKHLQEGALHVCVNCSSPAREGQRRSPFAMLERHIWEDRTIRGVLVSTQFIYE